MAYELASVLALTSLSFIFLCLALFRKKDEYNPYNEFMGVFWTIVTIMTAIANINLVRMIAEEDGVTAIESYLTFIYSWAWALVFILIVLFALFWFLNTTETGIKLVNKLSKKDNYENR